MRVVSVVQVSEGVVSNIESFGIFEEQLLEVVIEEAQILFVKLAKELGFEGDEDEEEDLISDGYYECNDMSVSLCWSEV